MTKRDKSPELLNFCNKFCMWLDLLNFSGVMYNILIFLWSISALLPGRQTKFWYSIDSMVSRDANCCTQLPASRIVRLSDMYPLSSLITSTKSSCEPDDDITARILIAFIASTWSWIKLIKGLKTTAIPGQHQAGSWYTTLFPPPVGIRQNTSRPWSAASTHSNWPNR